VNDAIAAIQKKLRSAGFDPGPIDGEWGEKSETALNAALTLPAPISGRPLAWGAKVSPQFRRKVIALCERLRMDPDYLMACIAWESAETFSPDIRNAAGSGAVGLIQFMPDTARNLGTTTAMLLAETAEEQLDYVEAYFRPYAGRVKSLSDHYMAILWPAAIGKPESAVLWAQGARPTTYRQNAGLDSNRDASITKAEAAGKVHDKLIKGLLEGNVYREQAP
jgi:hypothetical protein